MMQFSVAPWRVLSPENLAICRRMAALHTERGAEILALARESAKTGEPIVRSLEYAYPHQGYADVVDQFLLGPDILVAPVVEKGARKRRIVVPPGRWQGRRRQCRHRSDVGRGRGPTRPASLVPADRDLTEAPHPRPGMRHPPRLRPLRRRGKMPGRRDDDARQSEVPMRFGHFDDASREYVITTPKTPYPWINYLGSDQFFGLIPHMGGGYCFYRDAQLRLSTPLSLQ